MSPTLCLFQDPKVYVQTTLDVHKKYNALVMSAFNNDAGFVAALDKVSDPSVRLITREAPDPTLIRSVLVLSPPAGVRPIHQQQRRDQDGPVVQQVARAAGQILRLSAEEEVKRLNRKSTKRLG